MFRILLCLLFAGYTFAQDSSAVDKLTGYGESIEDAAIIIENYIDSIKARNIQLKQVVSGKTLLRWRVKNPSSLEFVILWCEGADTIKFPFRNGSNPDSIWNNEPLKNWGFARTYETKFVFISKLLPGSKYVRFGISEVNPNGTLGKIRCAPAVVRKEDLSLMNEVWIK